MKKKVPSQQENTHPAAGLETDFLASDPPHIHPPHPHPSHTPGLNETQTQTGRGGGGRGGGGVLGSWSWRVLLHQAVGAGAVWCCCWPLGARPLWVRSDLTEAGVAWVSQIMEGEGRGGGGLQNCNLNGVHFFWKVHVVTILIFCRPGCKYKGSVNYDWTLLKSPYLLIFRDVSFQILVWFQKILLQEIWKCFLKFHLYNPF